MSQAARAAGVNLAFFSGNEIFWKTRWETSIDGTNTPYRTLVTYKETHFNGRSIPTTPHLDGRVARSALQPARRRRGARKRAHRASSSWSTPGRPTSPCPSQYSKLRLWRNTAVASLAAGADADARPRHGTLGYEWDVDVDNGFRPAGEFDLSSTTVSGAAAVHRLRQHHAATRHRHAQPDAVPGPSGALVFGAGTVQWSWGLDDNNAWNPETTDRATPADPNMQQATVNLFADMGAQPRIADRRTGARRPRRPTPPPPTSTITSPTAGQQPAGRQQGHDLGHRDRHRRRRGRRRRGLHRRRLDLAPGDYDQRRPDVNWTYAWVAHGNPDHDDQVARRRRQRQPRDTLRRHHTSTSPARARSGAQASLRPRRRRRPQLDRGRREVHVETFGTVTGIRFYKAGGQHRHSHGSLWTASGQLLATATFTSETASGWQQVNFSSPSTIIPNTTYVASYFAPSGHYSATADYFYTHPQPGAAL